MEDWVMRIGDREITKKDFVAVGLIFGVVIMGVWAMVNKPKPVVLHPPTQPGGLILQEGGEAGGRPGQFQYPRGIAVDSQGDIYVADSRNHRIQKIDGKSGKFIKDFGGFFNVGGGDAKKLQTVSPGKLNEPNGIAIGPDDMVYVMDTWNGRVQVFNSNGRVKKIISNDDSFWGPREIAVDPSGISYVADTGKHRIVKFGPKGEKLTVWGVKGEKAGQLNEPIGLALDQAGNLYVADRLNFRIQVFTSEGQYLRQWKVDGWSKEQVDMEPHLALDKVHSLLYATDGRGRKVYCHNLDGKLLATLDKGSTGNSLFVVPTGIAVDKEGNVYLTDAAAAKIYKLKGQF